MSYGLGWRVEYPIVEASAIYVDPNVKILEPDITATVFEVVGMNNLNFTLESVKSLLAGYSIHAYMLDEVNGVVNTKWISSEEKQDWGLSPRRSQAVSNRPC